MKLFLGLLVLASTTVFYTEAAAATLTVRISDIPGAKGDLLVGIYATADSFTASPMEESPKIKLTTEEDQVVVFKDLKPGKYAIAVIQDLNENGKLDRNFLGIPKEPLAFSVLKKIPRGKPKFEACSFEIGKEPVYLVISLITK